jgi:hypothetical protein
MTKVRPTDLLRLIMEHENLADQHRKQPLVDLLKAALLISTDNDLEYVDRSICLSILRREGCQIHAEAHGRMYRYVPA